MALEKVQKIDKVEIVGDYKTFQIREATCILDDGVEISKTFHRASYSCLTDLAELPNDEIRALASTCWTEELKAEYQAYLDSQEV